MQQALVEEEGSDKTLMPPGFHLIHLPFKDDMREGVPVAYGMAAADEVGFYHKCGFTAVLH
jgi:hypothetical protein